MKLALLALVTLTACASAPRPAYVESVRVVAAPPCFGPYAVGIIVNRCEGGGCTATTTLLYGVRTLDDGREARSR